MLLMLRSDRALRRDGCDVQENPPFEMPAEASRQPGSTFAGYVSMTVLPQHVSSLGKIDRLAWVLLTLQAQLHTSIKEFKVCCCMLYIPFWSARITLALQHCSKCRHNFEIWRLCPRETQIRGPHSHTACFLQQHLGQMWPASMPRRPTKQVERCNVCRPPCMLT